MDLKLAPNKKPTNEEGISVFNLLCFDSGIAYGMLRQLACFDRTENLSLATC